MQLSYQTARLKVLSQHMRVETVLIALGVVYAVLMLATFPRWTVDDAYISFRYAYNLVHYGELNWNPGFDPVEGYTGIVLPLLMVPVIAFGGDPVVASQIMGVLAFGASAVLLWLILNKLAVVSILRGIALALYLIAPALYSHVYSGLETILFTTLILASFYALLCQADRVMLPLLLLTGLTRPEGVFLAILCIGLRIIQIWRHNEHLWKFFGFVMILYVLPGMLYFVWRWSYYGYLLPNTFYVKVNGEGSVITLQMWFLEYVSLPLLAVLLSIPTWSRVKQHGLQIAVAGIFIVILCLLYSRTMLVMNYAHRFYMPLYPVALIVLALLVRKMCWKSLYTVLPLTLLIAHIYLLSTTYLQVHKNWIIGYSELLLNEHVATAQFIEQHVPENEWVILNDTGIIPYRTHLKTIDSGKLNDEFLAHSRDQAAIRDYLESFDAAVVTRPWVRQFEIEAIDPYDYIMDLSNYQLITDYKDPEWLANHEDFRVYLFLRKDLIK